MCLHALTLKCNLGSLGYHAPRCTIDGPRTKSHVSLSPTHDREHWPCINMLKNPIPCTAACCCCQTIFCRNFVPTGRKECRPALYVWPIDLFAAGGHHKQPVEVSSSRWHSEEHKEGILGLWEFLERQDSKKQRRQWHGVGFSGQVATSMHHSRIPRQGLRPPFFYLLDLILVIRIL